MEPELAIESSREAIKVCLMVGGPILGVCLIVGLLMGIAQAMSQIQDQALATVPKILAILAVIGLALPWFADRMMDFSKDQFSKPMLAANASSYDRSYAEGEVRSLLDANVVDKNNYYPRPEQAQLQAQLQATPVSFRKERFVTPQGNAKVETNDETKSEAKSKTKGPFSLPSYRFSRRPGENIEG